MNGSDLILNTIVFKEDMEKGVLQKDLIKKSKDLGVGNLEIRREFLKDLDSELPAIIQEANQEGIQLFYSINDDFITGGKINPRLKKYIEEARILKAKVLKLNTGDTARLTVEELETVSPLLTEDLQISVENNQEPGHANLSNIRHFFSLLDQTDLPILFVFDTGNWAWVGDDAEEARQSLEPVSHYLHLKNFKRVQGKLEIASLFDGELDILPFVKSFSHTDYYALEYPCSPEVLQADIKKFLQSM